MADERVLGLGHGSAFGERGIAKRLAGLAANTTLSGGRLLDIGCGDGTYTFRLADDFEQVDAIDIQKERLDLFYEALKTDPRADKITVQDMSITAMDFPDNTFDLVVAFEVVEHVDDLDKALREVCRVLKPGGRFGLTTPNRMFPFETHGLLIRGKRYPPARGPFLPWILPLHRRLADARSFTSRGLTGQLRDAGLRPVGVEYVMPPFDRSSLGKKIRPLTDAAERSPLRVFGMALAVVSEKPA